MTDRDSEQMVIVSGSDLSIAWCSPIDGTVSPAAAAFTTPVPEQATQQGLDRWAPMLSGDVSVNFPPQPLDLIVVGAIRRQEVQLQPAGVLSQELLHAPAGVDPVVVQDQMDARRAWMAKSELLEQRQEEVAVLALRLHDQQIVAIDRECSGEVALAVLSRRHHELLLATQHPIPADARIQVDVDLVFEVGHLAGGEVMDDLEDSPQPVRFARVRPRPQNDRPGHAPARTEIAEHAGHSGHAHPHSRVLPQSLDEQLAGPGGTRPAVILWRDRHQLREGLSQVVVDLHQPIVAAAVAQPVLPERLEPARHAHRGGRHASQTRRDAMRSPTRFIQQHDPNPCPQSRVGGLAPFTSKSPLHPPRQSDYNASLHVGLLDGAPSTHRTTRRPFLVEPHTGINHLSLEEKITSGDPESRSAI